ncbi:MAG TPA: caspase family protein [Pirellulales bacterium]
MFAILLASRFAAPDVPAANAAENAGDKGRKFALLVGCTKYDHLRGDRWLKGPANDAVLLRRVLVERYGFPDANITLLTEDAGKSNRPTREHIVREFERLIAQAQVGDQVVVLLAGHGSQQPDRPDAKLNDPEPDGLDEIFLPADIDKWEDASAAVVNAIVDDEIFAWTQALMKKGASLWIIFDCCHSGTALRGGGDETAREASPEGDLGIPAAALRRAAERVAPAKAAAEAAFDVESAAGHVVAFYASQPQDMAVELAMPPTGGASEKQQHGAFSFALCSVLSEPGAASLTYRALGDLIWARYKVWRRASLSPPFIDGTDLDRQVLGAGRGRFQFRVVSGDAGRGWRINGGAVHGLTPGAILEARGPAGGGKPLGHVRVVRLDIAEARVEPCAYADAPKPDHLPAGAVCEPVFAEFGDLRLRVAIDLDGADAAARQSLVKLADDLAKRSREPKAMFALTVLTDAEWVVRARPNGLELLPKDAALVIDEAKLPPGTPRFNLGGPETAAEAEEHIGRIFRAQNLLGLAGGASGETGTVDLVLETIRYRDGRDRQGQVVAFEGAGPRFQAGDLIGWRITNHGREAVDVTLLYIDSQFAVQAVFPRPRAVGVNNRLAAGESYSVPPVEVTDDTLGQEHLVVIAVPGEGPQRDFRCLAEPNLASARVQTRGGANALESPLGKLLEYAAFNEGEATRGMRRVELDESRLMLVSWTVE